MSSATADPLKYEAPSWLKELDDNKPGVNIVEIKNRAICESYYVICGDVGVADLFPEEAVAPPEAVSSGSGGAGGVDVMIVEGGGADTALQWYIVIGKKGATVRKGVDLNTPFVKELARGTKVAVADSPKSYAEDKTKGSVRVYLRKPLSGWCSLKLLTECAPPKDAADAAATVAIVDVTDASADVAAARAEVEAEARARTRTLAEDFLSVREAPRAGAAIVGTVRRDRVKVTVVEFAPAGLHVGASNEALDARKDSWARISEPRAGWIPLCAVEADNVCANRYRLNDPDSMKRPPNIVPSTMNGDGSSRRLPIRCACLHGGGSSAAAFAGGEMGGIAAYLKRHDQMQLLFAEGHVKVFEGQHSRRGDRYVVDEIGDGDLDVDEPNCVGHAWLTTKTAEDGFEYRGVAEGLCALVKFLAGEGVKWRERRVHGCRFAVAHGQAADLLTILWAMAASGHLYDALKGCGGENAKAGDPGFPRYMKDYSRYVEAPSMSPHSCWFMPIAACLVGGGEWGWADQLDNRGQDLAVELRRLLVGAAPDATPADIGYKLKYGCDRHGDLTPLFTRSRLEFPVLHVVGKHDVYRACAEKLYCMYSDGSRRIMYYDGKTEMPDQEFYGAEICRFVARAMMEDAGTTYDYGIPGIAS